MVEAAENESLREVNQFYNIVAVTVTSSQRKHEHHILKEILRMVYS